MRDSALTSPNGAASELFDLLSEKGPVIVTLTGMTASLIGYARCFTAQPDLVAQRHALRGLGVPDEHIYLDQGLTGRSRARPGLTQALAAVRAGDTLVVAKLDRLARSVCDAHDIARDLAIRQVTLNLGGSLYDPSDATGTLLFTTLAMIAEFESSLVRMHTREGMAVARANGRLKGRAPKLSPVKQSRLVKLHTAGDHTISELAELFDVSRPTVYRVLERAGVASVTPDAA